MTDAAWGVIVGVSIAALVAFGRALLWVSRYAISAIATQVVDEIGDSLQTRWKADIESVVAPLREQIAAVRDEVTENGGGSLKDRVLSMERQLEYLITE